MIPADVWNQMLDGNRRFVENAPEHPHQDAGRRNELAASQAPRAALFGCSDSRLAAEIIFDMGLGDLFVVRNAGQVTGESIMGSLEYAVEVLKVPLIVVLSHDACGAVRAAIDSFDIDKEPLPPYIWRLIAPIVPAVQSELRAGSDEGVTHETVSAENVGRRHLEQTVASILRHSELISEAVAEGRLGIVGANYRLAEGKVEPRVVVGAEQ
ncbi:MULTISPECIES: carbonic anhydrase [unclassified Microbacterium]|uniref:carbonic anhydrase n=1 Tax=unclassified Microbacterium TaxID=2609290 RepID=UPI00097EECC8|nr:carbonic anhydrase [Microbacterium sp. JB110]RCS61884.1 carbonic anhydrase [Microbacterium sp. JB110]SJM66420.1 Carbonic anhydrase [Frigoribacterium sp. JB110]